MGNCQHEWLRRSKVEPTNKARHGPNDPHTKGNTLGWPHSFVEKCSENRRRGAMGRRVHKWDHDGEKSKNVENQDDTLNLGQQAANDRVHEYRYKEDRPGQESPVHWQIVIVGIV